MIRTSFVAGFAVWLLACAQSHVAPPLNPVVSVGATSTCAQTYGEIHCWGGAIGPERRRVVGIGRRLGIGPDLSAFAVGSAPDGELICFVDEGGRCGVVDRTLSVRPFEPNIAVDGAIDIAADKHVCAARRSEVWCWGGMYLPPPDGTGDAEADRFEVGFGQAVLEVVVGIAHSCARLRDATVWCWGADYAAQRRPRFSSPLKNRR